MKQPTGRPAALVLLALAASPAASAAGYKETLSLEGIRFEVSAVENGPSSSVTITPSGLKAVNDPVTHDVPGRVVRAEIADIDANGSPEIYVFTAGFDDKARGGVLAYGVNNKKSMSQIYLPDFTEDPKLAAGYAGGDESAIVETSFVTRFKLHDGTGASAKPTGKWRQLQYKLKPGEAGWKLVLEKVDEF